MTLGGVCLAAIAIFLPPLPVFIRTGCSAHLLINIGLLFLGWLPAVVHAWYVILEYPSLRQRAARKRDRRRYSGSVSPVAYAVPARRSVSRDAWGRRSLSRDGRRGVYREEVFTGPRGREREVIYEGPPPPRYSKY